MHLSAAIQISISSAPVSEIGLRCAMQGVALSFAFCCEALGSKRSIRDDRVKRPDDQCFSSEKKIDEWIIYFVAFVRSG